MDGRPLSVHDCEGVGKLKADDLSSAGKHCPSYLPGTPAVHARNGLSPGPESGHEDCHCLETSKGG